MSSIVGNNNNSMGTPFFHEFKKQASFFLKEKIKTARLALTDVTPAELLTEEVTNGNPWGPDTKTMGLISRAAFEVDDYWRIVEILHKKLIRFDRKNWRISYKTLVLLEHLLTHGPESIAEEFKCDIKVIQDMRNFQYIDERGFNWGLTMKNKSERMLKLLEKGPLLKEERNRARKVTRGIKGFGSFTQKTSMTDENRASVGAFGRCNSEFVNHGEDCGNQFSVDKGVTEGANNTQQNDFRNTIPEMTKNALNTLEASSNEDSLPRKSEMRKGSKENIMPREETLRIDRTKESKPLLGCQKYEPGNAYFTIDEEGHPFNNDENQSTTSLLSASGGI
ncbi:hypothetical protein C5167_029448 [Papaver somniferum]|uniref:ENTH domain-containing protein C794.11c-like n=1 Tax=Papaver somniferum TaxID=3469 RepID=UPI000E6FA87F|nr:ENTH domain-containing protein C794.11c-like [Papaver somniferum]RZC93812.1 hypothetical protein C5167_029448 [Papaver somniferum]